MSEAWQLATQLRVWLTTSTYDNVPDIEVMRKLAWKLVEELDKEENKYEL